MYVCVCVCTKVVKRIIGQWLHATATAFFAAQGTGDGESGIMARDGGKQDLENDEAMRTYIRKLMQWSRAGQLTHHLTRKLPKHDRAAHEVEEDLRQHVVCAAEYNVFCVCKWKL